MMKKTISLLCAFAIGAAFWVGAAEYTPDPETKEQMAAAIGLLRRGKLEDAGQAFFKMLRNQPDNTGAIMRLMQVSRFYAQQEKPDKALEWLDRTLAIAAHKGELHIVVATIHIKGKNEEKALEHIRAAIGADSCTPQILSGALTCLAELERFDGESREVAERLLSMQEGSIDAYLFLGLWHQENDHPKAARNCFLRAVFLDTNDVQARLMLGKLYEKMAKHDLAEREYIKMTKIAPRYFGGYLCLADLYEKTGDETRAEQFAEQAARLNPGPLESKEQTADEPAEDEKQDKPE